MLGNKKYLRAETPFVHTQHGGRTRFPQVRLQPVQRSVRVFATLNMACWLATIFCLFSSGRWKRQERHSNFVAPLCASRVAGAGRSSDFGSSVLVREALSVSQLQSPRQAPSRSPTLTFDPRLCPFSPSELQFGLESLSTSASSGDACDQARWPPRASYV